MNKKYLNQNGLSNKFWSISQVGKNQTIHFGKIGTQGRTMEKTFESEEKCISESMKIISEKEKSGYIEIRTGAALTDQESTYLAEDFFWKSIEKTNKFKSKNWKNYDADEHIESLTLYLSKFGKDTLIGFQRCLIAKLHELYTAEIAELSFVLQGKITKTEDAICFDDSLSDDGFVYFRCWILLKGRIFFDEVQFDIQQASTSKIDFYIDDCWAEGLLYAADEAYAVHNENIDLSEICDAESNLFSNATHYDSIERKMNRAPHSGKDLQKVYPKLTESIYTIRT